MDNMCSSTTEAITYDCNDNMIYSCWSPPMVKIIGANGTDFTLLLSDSFTEAYEIYMDSKNRLWISGYIGFVIYN
jgi:hypothetical protein